MRRLLLIVAVSCLVACNRSNGANAAAADASTNAAARPRQGMCSLSEVHELCNGLDDDCNGVIDDNAQCPAGQHCVATRCQ
jgi:hypothetical protein